METAIMKCIVAVLAIALSAPAFAAVATSDDARKLSSQYATWAGGKSNADALVNGMQNGTTVMLVTQQENNRSLAGFTPDGKMSTEEIAAALASAKSKLSSMGVRQPTADQIQAALIGGEVQLGGGRTKAVQGSVGHTQEPVALR